MPENGGHPPSPRLPTRLRMQPRFIQMQCVRLVDVFQSADTFNFQLPEYP